MALNGAPFWCCSVSRHASRSQTEAVVRAPDASVDRDGTFSGFCTHCLPERRGLEELARSKYDTPGTYTAAASTSTPRTVTEIDTRRDENSAQWHRPKPTSPAAGGAFSSRERARNYEELLGNAMEASSQEPEPDPPNDNTLRESSLEALYSQQHPPGPSAELSAPWVDEGYPPDPDESPAHGSPSAAVSEVTTSYASSSLPPAPEPLPSPVPRRSPDLSKPKLLRVTSQTMARIVEVCGPAIALWSKISKAWKEAAGVLVEVLERMSKHKKTLMFVAVLFVAIAVTAVVAGSILKEMRLEIPTHVPWPQWRNGEVAITQGNVSSTRMFDLMIEMQTQDISVYANFELVLVYEVLRAAPIPEVLWRDIFWEAANIERRLRSLGTWNQLCTRTTEEFRRLCNPGVSLAAEALPSLEYGIDGTTPTHLQPDGQGLEVQSAATAVHLAMRYEHDGVVLPTSSTSSAVLDELQTFRSVFTFRIYTCSSNDPPNIQRSKLLQVKEEWTTFMEEELVPLLEILSGEAGTDEEQQSAMQLPFKLRFTGHDAEDVQYRRALTKDVWPVMPFVLILAVLCMSAYLDSIALGSLGMFLIVLAGMLSHNTIKYLSKETELGLSSFMLPFLTFGIGSDLIFTVSEAWHEAMRRRPTEAERMLLSYVAAGKFPLAACASTLPCLLLMVSAGFHELTQMAYHFIVWSVFLWIGLVVVFVPALAVHERVEWRFCQRLKSACVAGALSASTARTSRRKSATGMSSGTRRTVLGVGLGDYMQGRSHPGVHSWQLASRFYSSRLSGGLAFALLHLIAFISFVVAAVVVKVDDVATGLFPDDHNLISSAAAISSFSSEMDELAPSPVQELVCPETDFNTGLSGRCALLWCEAAASSTSGQDSEGCLCSRLVTSSCPGPPQSVVQRFVHPSGLSSDQEPLSIAAISAIAAGRLSTEGLTPSDGASSTQAAPHMVLQSWEAGYGKLAQVVDIETVFDADSNSSQAACHWKDICFCKVETCLSEGFFTASLDVAPDEVQTSIDEAPLAVQPAEDVIVSEERVEAWRQSWPFSVEVVHGFNHPSTGRLSVLGTPAFGFFEPTGLDSQRSLLRMCTDTDTRSALRIASKQCWLEDFREWLYNRGPDYRYPMWAVQFNPAVNDYLDAMTAANSSSETFTWRTNGTLRAYYLRFYLDLPQNATYSDIRAVQSEWDSYVTEWAAAAPGDVQSVWHTSTLWDALMESEASAASAPQEADRRWIGPILLASAMVAIITVVITVKMLFGAAVLVTTVGAICIFGLYLKVAVDSSLGLLEMTLLVIGFCYASVYAMHVGIASLQGAAGNNVFVSSWFPVGASLPVSGITAFVTTLPFMWCRLPAFTRTCASSWVAVLISYGFSSIPLLLVRLGYLKQSLAEKHTRRAPSPIITEDDGLAADRHESC